MKYAGKKAAFMPKEKESAKEDKGENEKTESKPVKKGSGLQGFLGKKLFSKKKLAK